MSIFGKDFDATYHLHFLALNATYHLHFLAKILMLLQCDLCTRTLDPGEPGWHGWPGPAFSAHCFACRECRVKSLWFADLNPIACARCDRVIYDPKPPRRGS